MTPKTAFTRAVSPALVDCALTHLPAQPIDVPRAIGQHAAYEGALADAGLSIERLPGLESAPDGVFVEDTAIILGEHAVITRPSLSARAGETESTAAGLARYFNIFRLEVGALDGGDVLRIDRTLYVGLGSRTNSAAVAALKEIVAPLGYEVVPVEVHGCLHLKTGATFAGPDRSGTPILLVNPAWIPPVLFKNVEPLAVAADEPFAANSLRIEDRLIIAKGSPATRDRLDARGFDLTELDISELQKAEAGLTCMSIIAA